MLLGQTAHNDIDQQAIIHENFCFVGNSYMLTLVSVVFLCLGISFWVLLGGAKLLFWIFI